MAVHGRLPISWMYLSDCVPGNPPRAHVQDPSVGCTSSILLQEILRGFIPKMHELGRYIDHLPENPPRSISWMYSTIVFQETLRGFIPKIHQLGLHRRYIYTGKPSEGLCLHIHQLDALTDYVPEILPGFTPDYPQLDKLYGLCSGKPSEGSCPIIH